MAESSTHAIWVDPLAFDSLENGPPYLPERPRVMMAKNANSIEVLQRVCGAFAGMAMAELGALVAILRAASIVHQSHHWQTRGGNFFGDHLLFDRLYSESVGFIDQVAERAVGSGSRDLVCPKTQAGLIPEVVNYWCGSIQEPTSFDMVVVSLGVERCVLDCLKEARGSLETKGLLTDGTDNLLQGVADKHEEFLYLLQQRQGGRMASYQYKRTAGSTSEERSRRNKVNDALTKMSKVYHRHLPIQEIRDLLEANGFDTSELEGIYTGRDGKSHDKVGEHTYLSLSWHKMEESGNWEITAYVS
jgi:DNA-binding ferritin-like protein